MDYWKRREISNARRRKPLTNRQRKRRAFLVCQFVRQRLGPFRIPITDPPITILTGEVARYDLPIPPFTWQEI